MAAPNSIRDQSLVISWACFTTTFVGVRLLTHWIRDGHGPAGGGMSVGGRHFHHYNLGIALLSGVGAVGLRGSEVRRRHPATATAYGSALALIVDEFALLLDLKNVYWSSDGRKSVRCRRHRHRLGRHGSSAAFPFGVMLGAPS